MNLKRSLIIKLNTLIDKCFSLADKSLSTADKCFSLADLYHLCCEKSKEKKNCNEPHK